MTTPYFVPQLESVIFMISFLSFYASLLVVWSTSERIMTPPHRSRHRSLFPCNAAPAQVLNTRLINVLDCDPPSAPFPFSCATSVRAPARAEAAALEAAAQAAAQTARRGLVGRSAASESPASPFPTPWDSPAFCTGESAASPRSSRRPLPIPQSDHVPCWRVSISPDSYSRRSQSFAGVSSFPYSSARRHFRFSPFVDLFFDSDRMPCRVLGVLRRRRLFDRAWGKSSGYHGSAGE
jgi:hypothetical protein